MTRGRFDMPLQEERTAYLNGLARFNAGDFFDAHEEWERAWKGTSGRRSDFYQGLIQMAVALEHYRRLNAAGARKVFARALRRWSAMPDVYMGLDLRDFERRMRAALTDLLAAPEGAPVRLDPSGFFRVDWLYDPFDNPRVEGDD
jgi:predicted metal-dependent hydrolase